MASRTESVDQLRCVRCILLPSICLLLFLLLLCLFVFFSFAMLECTSNRQHYQGRDQRHQNAFRPDRSDNLTVLRTRQGFNYDWE